MFPAHPAALGAPALGHLVDVRLDHNGGDAAGTPGRALKFSERARTKVVPDVGAAVALTSSLR